ncbi:MAG: phosphopentomutase, partial [Erysipelotrichaceae bacterium]
MKKYKRIFTVIVDSLGIGAACDSSEYGDYGVDTLGHIDDAMNPFLIPNLSRLGLANLHPLKHCEMATQPLGYYTRLQEASCSKDTMSGHWEMMGLQITTPFKTFTEHGFPDALIKELEKRCGRTIIGNKAASGTEILDELALEEINHGKMIVYTSADSVLQICGHEESFGLEELYRCCEIARELTMQK